MGISENYNRLRKVIHGRVCKYDVCLVFGTSLTGELEYMGG
uniref:Uncharacterized protein n=1 Tax=Rhizophora mucronata TaxID=61149 RepID=A0A2P2NZP4_RHIMU